MTEALSNNQYLDSSVKVIHGGERGAGAEPLLKRAPLGASWMKAGRRPDLMGGKRTRCEAS